MSFPSGLVLAHLDVLPDLCAIVVTPDAGAPFVSIILTRRGDQIAAFHNKCPHAGYPLQRADGRIVIQEGRYIVCGAHGASFTLDGGVCAGGPCNGDPLERIEIELREGKIVTL
ncbi:MAG: Rieske (2Fe-2S) protein [Caulobacteraceae bacterium]